MQCAGCFGHRHHNIRGWVQDLPPPCSVRVVNGLTANKTCKNIRVPPDPPPPDSTTPYTFSRLWVGTHVGVVKLWETFSMGVEGRWRVSQHPVTSIEQHPGDSRVGRRLVQYVIVGSFVATLASFFFFRFMYIYNMASPKLKTIK